MFEQDGVFSSKFLHISYYRYYIKYYSYLYIVIYDYIYEKDRERERETKITHKYQTGLGQRQTGLSLQDADESIDGPTLTVR